LPHVDFLRRRLAVEQQLVTLAGRPPYLAPPKTAASRRAIPLPTVVSEALASHLERFPAGDAGLIFTTERGEPIRRNRFGEVWRRAADAAGLAEGVGFHALRHYYASLLIRHGESVKVVQERLGHASAAETLDTYSHLWPDSEDRTRAAVDAVLGSPNVTVPTRNAQ
ncbi:MAG TPA: site-specific integrase, partial [Acidimicrobiales bacterium]|nr:site-specific integrase [Acidimicrobiales bacterium]